VSLAAVWRGTLTFQYKYLRSLSHLYVGIARAYDDGPMAHIHMVPTTTKFRDEAWPPPPGVSLEYQPHEFVHRGSTKHGMQVADVIVELFVQMWVLVPWAHLTSVRKIVRLNHFVFQHSETVTSLREIVQIHRYSNQNVTGKKDVAE
jgi:hypothetical protein